MRVEDLPEIARLTIPEKILLLEDLWDSIASEEPSIPLPQSHREELDRRLAEYERDPGTLLTLDDLRGRIEGDRVVVFGVFHCARDPRRLRAELGDRQ